MGIRGVTSSTPCLILVMRVEMSLLESASIYARLCVLKFQVLNPDGSKHARRPAKPSFEFYLPEEREEESHGVYISEPTICVCLAAAMFHRCSNYAAGRWRSS
eukprot:1155905-Pelagomonas_calceolata.AAC.5